MANSNNIENHKWQPGQSGNPYGRPKGALNSRTLLKKWLGVKMKSKDPITKKDINVTAEEAIVMAAIGQAMKGNIHAFNSIFDRVEGKVNQRIEMTGEDGGPIVTETNNNIDYSKLPTDVLKAIAAARKSNSKEIEHTTEKASKAKKSTTRKGTGNKKT